MRELHRTVGRREARKLARSPDMDRLAEVQARTETRRAIPRIRERTALQRRTAATDAAGKAELQELQFRDALIDTRGP